MRLPVALLAALTLGACTDGGGSGALLVTNDEDALEARVTYSDTPLTLEAPAAKGRAKVAAKPAKADDLSLTLVAEVTPPQYDGVTLQANEVRVRGRRAYVAYNVRGATYLGGIDVFDISDPTRPRLVSSALLPGRDVNGITVKNHRLYLVGASDDADLTTPAFLGAIALRGGKLTDTFTQRDLPSYAGTDVDVAGPYLYATSGDTGGAVSVYRLPGLSLVRSEAVDDARGVDADRLDVAVVAGTPARLFVFDRDAASLTAQHTLSGATIPESKSTVEVKRRKAVLALGDGGTQVVCLADGSVLARLDPPTVADLDPSVTVTNAASAYRRAIFMANGEAGVYVAMADSNLNGRDCEVDNLEVVGRIRFGDLQSANHVVYRHDLLFVAAGTGGLKIVAVTDAGADPDDDDEDDD